jgi:GNAT superfamily N-acetyltransferase
MKATADDHHPAPTGSAETLAETQMDALRHRFANLPAPSPADELHLEPGEFGDFKRLASFHYRSVRAGAVTTAYRLRYAAPTVVGRYLSRASEQRIVGVLLRCLPHLACRLRDVATGNRYRGFGQKAAAEMLNREVRTITRVVIDPQWRGLGLAVRLVRHALEHGETIYTEALAAMGRVHPFCQRAGMTRYDRPPHPADARLMDVLQRLAIEPAHLASRRLVQERLSACSESDARWFAKELRHWYRAASYTTLARLNQLKFDDLLVAARDRLLTRPVYYLFDHRRPLAGESS